MTQFVDKAGLQTTISKVKSYVDKKAKASTDTWIESSYSISMPSGTSSATIDLSAFKGTYERVDGYIKVVYNNEKLGSSTSYFFISRFKTASGNTLNTLQAFMVTKPTSNIATFKVVSNGNYNDDDITVTRSTSTYDATINIYYRRAYDNDGNKVDCSTVYSS